MAEPILSYLGRFKGALTIKSLISIIYNLKKTLQKTNKQKSNNLGQITQSARMKQIPNKAESRFVLQKFLNHKPVLETICSLSGLFTLNYLTLSVRNSQDKSLYLKLFVVTINIYE